MRKLLVYSVLGAATWLAVTVGWAVTAHVSGLPGPARAAWASIGAVADAVVAVEAPGALGIPQRLLARQLRAGGRLIARTYEVPERIAARLVGHGRWHSLRVHPSFCLARRGSPKAKAAPRETPTPRAPGAHIHGEGASLAPRIQEVEARVEARLDALRERIAAREAVLRLRLERLDDGPGIRIRTSRSF